ncbi:MAG: tyrosinase family protein [Gemmataceae bacterium]
MNEVSTNRRAFLLRSGAVASLSILGFHWRNVSSSDDPVNETITVRPDVSTLLPDGPEIGALRKGVKVMMDRDPTDKTSWTFQANIHGTYDDDPQPGWNQCQHGSFFFFSWHRMYLYFFERILRKASGENSLALPYWNYNQAAARDLPFAFRDPADTKKNSLYRAERGQGINFGARLPASATINSTAFSFTNFTAPPGSPRSFGGQRVTQPTHSADHLHGALEHQPHDAVHDQVGGSGLMGDPNTAAQDPIFWLHHANIDRLWKRWLDQKGGRQNPLDDQNWMDKVLFEFFDEDGKSVKMSGKDVLDTEKQLGYRYDDDPPNAPAVLRIFGAGTTPVEVAKKKPVVVAESKGEKPFELGLDPVAIDIPLDEKAKDLVNKVSDPKMKVVEQALILKLQSIEVSKNPGTHYEVYLDLPKRGKADYQSVHYVGNLTFFGLAPPKKAKKGHEEKPNADRSYDITAAVRELRNRKLWVDDKVVVTFVRKGLIGADNKEIKPEEVVKVSIGKVFIISE